MVNAMQMEKRTRYVLFVVENKGTMGALGIFDMENIKIARIRKLFYKMGRTMCSATMGQRTRTCLKRWRDGSGVDYEPQGESRGGRAFDL